MEIAPSEVGKGRSSELMRDQAILSIVRGHDRTCKSRLSGLPSQCDGNNSSLIKIMII